MDIIVTDPEQMPVFNNPGKESVQIVCAENDPGAQVTITRVTMKPGAVSEVHIHSQAEQVWLIERGEGQLLMADGLSKVITAGQVVRTPIGISHGIRNAGECDLVYLSVTTPPEDMEKFYGKH